MRRYRRRARSQYLLPFIILISLGVFLILAFQLWGSLFPTVKGDALYYLPEGRSKVLAFGTTEWANIYNGTKVKLGDSVKTLQGAKGALQFYDGTIVRLDADTQVTLVDIADKNDYQEIYLYLNGGKAWVNKPKQNVVRKTNFIITTNYASYTDTGTIFDLEKLADDEVLHVMKGQVQVDILENAEGKTRTIESIPVGIGQQIVLSAAVMQEFYQRQSPSVLSALDPIFQTTDWYLWNTKEDENPTDFSKHGTETITDVEGTPNNSTTTITTSDLNLPKSDLAAPTLISPKLPTIIAAKDNQLLTGKVAEGTKKLLLKQLLAGDQEVQKILINTLDTDKLTWDYEISVQKSNLKSGKNVYDFVGIDDNARETAALHVVIDYQAPDEPDLANDKSDLEKPVVTTVDGKPYQSGMTIDHDSFVISGTINGADQVWVNDFQLSKFVTGNKAWTYNVRTTFGNLVPGLNSYKVYGATSGGKKSTVLTVQINYKPASKPVTTTTVTPATTTTATTAVPTPTISTPEKPLNS